MAAWFIYIHSLFVAIDIPLPRRGTLDQWVSIESGAAIIRIEDELDYRNLTCDFDHRPVQQLDLRPAYSAIPFLWFNHWPSLFDTSVGSHTRISLWPVLLAFNIPAVLLARKSLIVRRRRHAHACISCGYKLLHLPSPTCPECGNHP